MSKISCKNCPVLSSCSFRFLTEDEINMLDEIKTSIKLVRGENLHAKDQEASWLSCIQSGYVKIIWPDQNFQKESIVKIVSPGDMTGYRCLFSESKFRATAVALEPVSACRVPKDFFFELLQKNKDFNFDILNKMGVEIRNSEQRLHSFCTKNVRERLCECLLQLIEIAGHKNADDSYSLKIKLSRDEISSLIGTAKETVVRALTDLKEEKVLTQEEQTLIILNLEKLNNIANNIH
jgi:CRP-like cAMP-binding protein